jgi:hypothetical protein
LGKDERYFSLDADTMDSSVYLANIFDPISTPTQAMLELSWLVLWIFAGIFVVVAGLLVYTRIRTLHEVPALVACMQTLRKPHESVARDAMMSTVPSGPARR